MAKPKFTLPPSQGGIIRSMETTSKFQMEPGHVLVLIGGFAIIFILLHLLS